MSEEILDDGTRNAILARVVGLKSPVRETVSREPVPVVETEVEKVIVCRNCNHKIWNDGSDWYHSGQAHDANCECRTAIPVGKSVTTTKETVGNTAKFDSSTPSNKLLEACIAKRTVLAEEETRAKDELRENVLSRVLKDGPNLGFIKNWKF